MITSGVFNVRDYGARGDGQTLDTLAIQAAIDACAQLRAAGVQADDVEHIEIAVHSLVLELTGKKEPKDGLEAKFSVYHGCAAGLLFGRAGEAEFADDVVTRADVVAARRKVVATVDPAIDEAEVRATAVLRNGERREVHVEHAIGSLQRPLSDADLERKFTALAEPVLGAAAVHELMAQAWSVGKSANLRALAQRSVPA